MMNKSFTTSLKTFCEVDYAGQHSHIFSIAEGIEAEHALSKTSSLLEVVISSLDDVAMHQAELKGHDAWLALHALESAKAIIDSLWATLQLADPDIDAQTI
jgi:hypothetical protein